MRCGCAAPGAGAGPALHGNVQRCDHSACRACRLARLQCRSRRSGASDRGLYRPGRLRIGRVSTRRAPRGACSRPRRRSSTGRSISISRAARRAAPILHPPRLSGRDAFRPGSRRRWNGLQPPARLSRRGRARRGGIRARPAGGGGETGGESVAACLNGWIRRRSRPCFPEERRRAALRDRIENARDD